VVTLTGDEARIRKAVAWRPKPPPEPPKPPPEPPKPEVAPAPPKGDAPLPPSAAP